MPPHSLAFNTAIDRTFPHKGLGFHMFPPPPFSNNQNYRARCFPPREALSPRDIGAPTPFRIRAPLPLPKLPPTPPLPPIAPPPTLLLSRVPLDTPAYSVASLFAPTCLLLAAPGPGPALSPPLPPAPPPLPGVLPAVPSHSLLENASGISSLATPPALTFPRLNGPYRVLASRFTFRHRCLQIFRI